MNEREWQAAIDPGPMLESLRHSAAPRKLYLFAAACHRRAGDVDTNQALVDVLESSAEHTTRDDAFHLARATAGETAGQTTAQRDAGRLAQCLLLRCIFGNPFRPVTLSDACRTSDVVPLARAAYDERSLPGGELEPERLKVLADALEEAGAEGEILGHLRGPGPHVRGCWAVDACLE